mmetsp:Transcript_48177/g.71389  ORF Transcript_48177/g.71389 Transcript_48177/m.71389 type:complete len:210 (-) Transcript_48177:40-669(-)
MQLLRHNPGGATPVKESLRSDMSAASCISVDPTLTASASESASPSRKSPKTSSMPAPERRSCTSPTSPKEILLRLATMLMPENPSSSSAVTRLRRRDPVGAAVSFRCSVNFASSSFQCSLSARGKLFSFKSPGANMLSSAPLMRISSNSAPKTWSRFHSLSSSMTSATPMALRAVRAAPEVSAPEQVAMLAAAKSSEAATRMVLEQQKS